MGYELSEPEGRAAVAAALGLDALVAAAVADITANLVGTAQGLVVQVTSNSAITIAASAVIVANADGISTVLRDIDLTADLATDRDAGAEANSTWYHVWLFYDPEAGTTAVRFSTSATAPTAPAGHTYKARLGAVRNDASGNLWRTRQIGRRTLVQTGVNPAVYPVAASGAAGTASDASPALANVSLAAFVPATAVRVYLNISSTRQGGAESNVFLAASTAAGGANRGPEGSAGQTWAFAGSGDTVRLELDLEDTQQIAWASSAAGGALGVAGWEEAA